MSSRMLVIAAVAALTACGSTQPIRVTELQACPVTELQPPRCPPAQVFGGAQGRFVEHSDWLICSAIAGAWHDAWADCAETIQP